SSGRAATCSSLPTKRSSTSTCLSIKLLCRSIPGHWSMPKGQARPLLKVGFVLDDSLDRPDGVQQYVVAVGNWLKQRGHSVRYIASTTHRTDMQGIHSLGSNIAVRFNGNVMRIPLPANRRHIREVLDSERFDILHVQMPFSPFLAGRVLAMTGAETAVIG